MVRWEAQQWSDRPRRRTVSAPPSGAGAGQFATLPSSVPSGLSYIKSIGSDVLELHIDQEEHQLAKIKGVTCLNADWQVADVLVTMRPDNSVYVESNISLYTYILILY